MKRILKQILYGAFFLSILGAVAGALSVTYFRAEQSCFDGEQNQEETGIDCGGPCISCELTGARLETGALELLPDGEDRITLFTEVKNPLTTHMAIFDYRFDVAGVFGGTVASVGGSSSVEPEGVRRVVAPGIPVGAQDVSDTKFTITGFEWREGSSPQLLAVHLRDVETTVSDGRVKVTGTLVNTTPLKYPLVRVSAFVSDDGGILGASATELADLPAFGEREFAVFFPDDENLGTYAGEAETRVFWEIIE